MGDNQEPTAEPLESALSVESTPQDPRLTLEAEAAIRAYLKRVTTSVAAVVGIVAFTLGFVLSEQAKSLAAREISEKVIEVDRALLAAKEATASARNAKAAAAAELVSLRDIRKNAEGTIRQALESVQANRNQAEGARKEAEAARDALNERFGQVAEEVLADSAFEERVLGALTEAFIEIRGEEAGDRARFQAELDTLKHDLEECILEVFQARIDEAFSLHLEAQKHINKSAFQRDNLDLATIDVIERVVRRAVEWEQRLEHDPTLAWQSGLLELQAEGQNAITAIRSGIWR